MTIRRLFLVLVPAVLLCGYAVAAEKDALKSGPQAGDKLPGPFHSLVAYSAQPGLVGTKTDFIEMYGQDPVVLVFAREMKKPLTRLVNALDAEAAKQKSARLKVIVVLLSDDDALENNLKEYGEKQGIKQVNLAIMEPTGPIHYKLSKEADVTVLLYKRQKVQANHAFKKGELNEDGVEKIVADVPKILPKR
jgi:hypothetical protein